VGAILTQIHSKNFCRQRLKKERNRYIQHTTLDSIMMQLEIDCLEWALKKIEVNKLPIDRLEAVIRTSDIS
jgi:hypothetical protein